MTHAWMAGAATAFLTCWALVLTQRWHGRYTWDGLDGVQKHHSRDTPRVGGLGVLAGLGVTWLWSPSNTRELLQPALLACLPAFMLGLAEDLTKRIGALPRLLATMGSGVLACLLTETALRHTGLPWLDGALQAWWPVAVGFTAIAVGGVANAINIVDGSDGLAAGLVIIGLLALSGIALQVGDTVLAQALLAGAVVCLGFLAVNFPMGKIFLGDGGAYLLGCWLAWLAVQLIERNPSVSPSAVLLCCAYPVVEVLFSIYRRLRRAQPAMQPDRLHLHSLIQSRLARKWLRRWPERVRQASVAPVVWVLSTVPAVLGVWFWQAGIASWACLLAFVAMYGLIYRRLVRFSWR